MTTDRVIAHSGATPDDEQALDEHLFAVAHLADGYAHRWGGPQAFISGLWHDLGKYQRQSQIYLKSNGHSRRVTHSTAGALHLLSKVQQEHPVTIDRMSQIPSSAASMMMAIMAHHGRLPDRSRIEERLGLTTSKLVSPGIEEYQATLAAKPPTTILDHDLRGAIDAGRNRHPLFARMLLSALVDADVVNTSSRKATRLKTMDALKARLDLFMEVLATKAESTEVNRLRGEVLAASLAMAGSGPGFFRLDAPTGFAKTYSSLAFALEHARRNGFDRIIYVAPFLTAIEQTALSFRKAFAVTRENKNLTQFTVLEDHSTSERDAERSSGGSGTGVSEDPGFIVRDRLRENWEARIIVTSNVQFLESLHAHDRGRCRKLHRIANAVVLLDEPQSIPVSLFAPTVDTFQELVRTYRTSIVFITATQPAFEFDRNFQQGIPASDIKPILPANLLERLRAAAASRVTVTLPVWGDPELMLDEVADRLVQRPRATLCIVNTRADAAALYRAVVSRVGKYEPVFHLSASMCSDHRAKALKAIRQCLHAKRLFRVISTQVVEAGIDIDFPVVMRAMAGLDSLIQSAGRCNRHGVLDRPGEFEVFLLTGGVPHMFRLLVDITQSLLRSGQTLFDPKTSEHYYKRVRRASDKGEDILEAQGDWNMTTVGTEYRLIEPTRTLVVPFGRRGASKVVSLRQFAGGTLPEAKRKSLFTGLAGITVSVHENAGATLVQAGEAVECGDFGLLVVVQDGDRPYDMAALGLTMPQAEAMLTEKNR